MQLRSLCAAAILVVGAPSALAATITVPSPAAPTIQAAIDAANPGDEIVVRKGKYPGGIVITAKTDLTVRGLGATIDGTGSEHCFTFSSSTRVALRGFKMKNASSEFCALEDSTDCEVSDCTITGTSTQTGEAVAAYNVPGFKALRLKITNTTRGILLNLGTDGAVVEDCKITKVRGAGIAVYGSVGGTFRRNRITKAAGRGMELGQPDLTETGQGHLATDNKITSPGDEGFRITASSVTCSRNKVKKCVEDGFRVLDDEATLEDNVVTSPGDDGYFVDAALCTLRRNKVTKPADDGFEIDGDDNVLEDDTCTKAADAGFDMDGDGNTLRRCSAKKSKGFDIEGSGSGTVQEDSTFGKRAPGF